MICESYKQMIEEITLEKAHKDINDFVTGIMSEL